MLSQFCTHLRFLRDLESKLYLFITRSTACGSLRAQIHAIAISEHGGIHMFGVFSFDNLALVLLSACPFVLWCFRNNASFLFFQTYKKTSCSRYFHSTTRGFLFNVRFYGFSSFLCPFLNNLSLCYSFVYLDKFAASLHAWNSEGFLFLA